MTKIEISRTVAGTPRAVFDTVAHGGNYGKAIPEIDTVEFLTDHETGIGARFRETRRFHGFQAIFAKVFGLSETVSEVTAFEDEKTVSLLTENLGAAWHTTFTVTPENDQTRLDMLVAVEPLSLLGRLVTPLLGPAAEKGITDDVEAVKAYVEKQASSS